jgi:hypothetical protein
MSKGFAATDTSRRDMPCSVLAVLFVLSLIAIVLLGGTLTTFQAAPHPRSNPDRPCHRRQGDGCGHGATDQNGNQDANANPGPARPDTDALCRE